MTQPVEHRICTNCGIDRRTTISEIEMPIYYCEDCLTERGELAFKNSSGTRGMWILLICVVITFIIGFLIGRT